MEIMVARHGFTEEVVNLVKNVGAKFCEKKYVVEALTGVLIAKNNQPSKKGPKGPFLKKFYLALSYFLRGLPPKYLRR